MRNFLLVAAALCVLAIHVGENKEIDEVSFGFMNNFSHLAIYIPERIRRRRDVGWKRNANIKSAINYKQHLVYIE